VGVCLQLKDTSLQKIGTTGMCPMGESQENMSRSYKPNKMGKKNILNKKKWQLGLFLYCYITL